MKKRVIRLFGWLARLFGGRVKARPAGRHANWPTKEQMARLPAFQGLELEQIVVVETDAGAKRAFSELMAAQAVGFDTESKPTFVKGHVSNGPHVVQFATLERAYIFPLRYKATYEYVCDLIRSPELKKVGFGLNDDLRRIESKLGIKPQSVLDLESTFTERGMGRGVGVRVGVAMVFKRQFLKSKRASTSNWAAHELNEKQLLYAANDAYAPLRVFHAFGMAPQPR